ncbi:MAG: outer membrane lipoprotein carrier protein LolA [Bacteroidales bacterium]|nr:outer membrane lipoprotein carrier protein LolA [Bacteroidales bacterium]
MKMIRAIAILLPLTMAFLSSTAQDTKAEKILKSLQDKTLTYKTIQADFTYTVSNPGGEPDLSFRGTLYIKGDSYRLSIAGQLVICDGETTWTYLEEAQEVQINAVEDVDESFTPSTILTSVFKDHHSEYLGEYSQDGRILQRIGLIPEKSKTYSKIVLGIDKSKPEIVHIDITDKSGNTYTYHITRFITDIPVGDDKFTFNANAFPDAEIIDMR